MEPRHHNFCVGPQQLSHERGRKRSRRYNWEGAFDDQTTISENYAEAGANPSMLTFDEYQWQAWDDADRDPADGPPQSYTRWRSSHVIPILVLLTPPSP
jgi:hypothetical protein